MSNLNFISKIILFLIVFTVIFVTLHTFSLVKFDVLNNNLNGISWLYSTIALIFSIVSAFIMQTQWNRWDRLENSVRLEVNGLWELISVSDQLPQEVRLSIRSSIASYLEHLIHDEDWRRLDRGERVESVESSVGILQKDIFYLEKNVPEYAQLAGSIFLSIQNNRNDRLHYSSGHIPFLLYVVIGMATFLVITLSLLIAVSNTALDYIFTVSVGVLAFSIFMVIEDLNHPYRPGSWHLKKDKYRKLHDMIQEG